jgi:hypothetical protein
MSHLEVAKYVAEEKPELSRAWLHLLAFVQGMYPQRRITSIHVEEENEDWGSAYFLESQMATIHPLFVAGAASACNRYPSFGQMSLSKSSSSYESGNKVPNNRDSLSRPVKVGCILREPNATAGTSISGSSPSDVEMRDITVIVDAIENTFSEENMFSGDTPQPAKKEDIRDISNAGISMPASLASLISECTQVLDTWLALDAARELAKSGESGLEGGQESGPRRGIQWRYRGGRGVLIAPNQDVAIIPAPVVAAEGEGLPARGDIVRGGTILDWVRRSRRFPVLEPRVMSEVVPEDASGSTATAGDSTVDMDVDVSRVGSFFLFSLISLFKICVLCASLPFKHCRFGQVS